MTSIYTIQNIEDWANMNFIPMLCRNISERQELQIVAFSRDIEYIQKELQFPCGVNVQYFAIPEWITYSKQGITHFLVNSENEKLRY